MSFLHNALASVLERPPASRINFNLARLLVTPRGFSDIGSELRRENIHVVRSSDLPQEAVAAYNWREDTMTVCEAIHDVLNNPWGKAVLVHESVHAMVDRNRAGSTPVLKVEVAAFIAQVLYRLLSNERGFRTSVERDRASEDGAIFYEALQVISATGLETAFATIAWADTSALQQAIQRHSLYHRAGLNDPHGADGIYRHHSF